MPSGGHKPAFPVVDQVPSQVCCQSQICWPKGEGKTGEDAVLNTTIYMADIRFSVLPSHHIVECFFLLYHTCWSLVLQFVEQC